MKRLAAAVGVAVAIAALMLGLGRGALPQDGRRGAAPRPAAAAGLDHWAMEELRYRNTRRSLAAKHRPYRVWQRTPNELWVYDNRVEVGMGMHGLPPHQIRMVKALGIRLVRHTMSWNRMENTNTPGKLSPEYLKYWDELTALAKREGIELEVVVHENAPGTGWANRKESYRRYAQFMGRMARRYPSIRYWELWNEMDVGFTDLFGAGVTPEVPMVQRGRHYAEMLKLAYPAIKRANPKALVLTGGMSTWSEFARGIYEGGGKPYFDIMNLHVYGIPVEQSLVLRGAQLRDVMAEFGDGERPLWNTEFGVDAGSLVAARGFPHDRGKQDGPGFDEMQRQQWEGALRAAIETGLYAKVVPYQFQAGNDARREELSQASYAERYLPAGRTIEDYGFGIVRSDGVTPRPTYEWLKKAQLNRAIRAAPSFVTDVTVSPAPAGKPVGYRSVRKGKALVIQGVRVHADEPTRIRLSRFRRGEISSYGGAVLLAGADRELPLTEKLAACSRDPGIRAGSRTRSPA